MVGNSEVRPASVGEISVRGAVSGLSEPACRESSWLKQSRSALPLRAIMLGQAASYKRHYRPGRLVCALTADGRHSSFRAETIIGSLSLDSHLHPGAASILAVFQALARRRSR